MNLVDYLMSGKERGSASGQHLQSLGRTAAQAYTNSGTPMNDTIAGMAKEASLNHDQIKRVAEAANTEVFIHEFARPYELNIAYPLADAAAIANRVQATHHVEKTASVALSAPRQRRYVPGSETASLEQLFGGRSFVKEAAAPVSQERMMQVYRGLSDMHRNARGERDAAEVQFLSKMAALQRVVHREISSGETPWAVGAAVALANPSQALFSVISSELGNAMEARSLVKVAEAGYQVEPDNAVTGLVQDLEAITEKLMASEETVQRTKAAIDELLTMLRGQPEPNPTSDLFAENASASASATPQNAPGQQAGAPPQGGMPQQYASQADSQTPPM